ncbi:hypothetical protein [Rhodococcus sp. NPDC058514]|uniref:hypothetical protein n=1 Tax=unclassified Rhodococcus (in: high G+C Gram-positive bacteria) TaxID=192944 RepID=UPI003647326D
MRPADDLGGDPVCWLDRVCPECGAFLPDGPDHGCARCVGSSGSRCAEAAEPHIPAAGHPST